MKFPIRFFLCVLIAACASQAEDWPQWRGPNRNGTSSDQISIGWDTNGPPVIWRASVGIGFSSIAVSHGRACTMGNTNDQETVWCLDAKTGSELWKLTYPARLDPQWNEGGPGATPTIDDGRVFTIGKWGEVFCFELASGKVVWRRDLKQDRYKPNRWGFAGSPLIWHDLVILNAGSAGIALDRRTGEVVWSSGTNGAAYASPTLFTINGKESVLIFAAKNLIALDPQTGRELWRHFWETGWDTNITDPLPLGDRIFISSFSRGCALLSPTTSKPDVIYDSKILHNHLSPGILIGEYLYAFNGEAKTDTDFRCVQVPTGQMKWMRKDPAFGSLILARDQLIVLSDKGELLVAQPSPEGLSILARSKVLTGTCWTPPALANGLLYLRNAKGELRCLDVLPRKGT